MTIVKVTNTQQVLVKEISRQLVKVTVPSQVAAIKVVTAGPQGPSFVPDSRKIDASTIGVIYTGRALHGAAESSPIWTITRSTYSAAGVRTSKGTAVNVTWTGRAGHTYT